jgi:hypothetical protein
MTAPNVNLTVADNSLGILPESVDGIHVKIGVCSAGPFNALQSFSDHKTLHDAMGEGPLVASGTQAFVTSVNGKGPRPIYFMRVNPSTAATVSAVTTTRVSTSTGTVATTGTVAFDTFDVKVRITRTGTLGAAAFQYSLDGGDVFSAEVAVPGGGTYAVPNSGVVVVFTAGGGPIFFELGDLFVFTTTAPYYTTGDLATTMAALFADVREWEFVHAVGAPGGVDNATKVTNFVAVATAIGVHMATALANGRYVWALLELPDVSNDAAGDAAIINGTASFADVRVSGAGGYSEAIDALTGRQYRRPDAWAYAGRVAAIPISEDPARVRSGPVTGIVTLGRNEEARPGLDSARITTLRQFLGASGVWVTNGRMLAPSGSDFDLVMNRRVMDRACRIAREALRQFLGEKVRVNGANAIPPGNPGAPGTIDERDARAAEGFVQSQLEAALLGDPQHASAVAVQCNRTDAILSTRRLRAVIRVTPLGYIKAIDAEIGFTNPALALLQPAA